MLEKLTASYRLDLPPHMKIHPVFHVSQLKLYRRPEYQSKWYEKPDPIVTAEGAEEYQADEVVNHGKRCRGRTTKIEYLVFWKGYPTHEMTWEPEENLANVQEKVADYYRRIEGNASLKVGSM